MSKRNDDWPRSKTAVRVIRRGPVDDHGRCSFDLLWWDRNGAKRAQSYFAKPNETRRMLLRQINERSQP